VSKHLLFDRQIIQELRQVHFPEVRRTDGTPKSATPPAPVAVSFFSSEGLLLNTQPRHQLFLPIFQGFWLVIKFSFHTCGFCFLEKPDQGHPPFLVDTGRRMLLLLGMFKEVLCLIVTSTYLVGFAESEIPANSYLVCVFFALLQIRG
jgi:hypothetical protein